MGELEALNTTDLAVYKPYTTATPSPMHWQCLLVPSNPPDRHTGIEEWRWNPS